MKKYLIAFPLLLLSACNDAADIERVKSQVLTIDQSITLGGAFDHRPACAETTWTQFTGDKGRPTVEYRCHFSSSAVQPEFQKLLTGWRQQNNLALVELRKTLSRVQEEKQQALGKLDKAKQLFERLQANGDLQRYRELVKGSPAETLGLDKVNNYFADISSDSYIAERFHGDSSVKTVVARVYQAVKAAGFTAGSPYNERCRDPIGLVLDVYPSLAETTQQFITCQGKIAQQHQYDIDDTNQKIAAAEAFQKKIDKNITLVGFLEIFRWSVIGNEDPLVYFHGFELVVNNGSEQRYALPTGNISGVNFTHAYNGMFDGYYQYVLKNIMDNLIK